MTAMAFAIPAIKGMSVLTWLNAISIIRFYQNRPYGEIIHIGSNSQPLAQMSDCPNNCTTEHTKKSF